MPIYACAMHSDFLHVNWKGSYYLGNLPGQCRDTKDKRKRKKIVNVPATRSQLLEPPLA